MTRLTPHNQLSSNLVLYGHPATLPPYHTLLSCRACSTNIELKLTALGSGRGGGGLHSKARPLQPCAPLLGWGWPFPGFSFPPP